MLKFSCSHNKGGGAKKALNNKNVPSRVACIDICIAKSNGLKVKFDRICFGRKEIQTFLIKVFICIGFNKIKTICNKLAKLFVRKFCRKL